MTVNKSKDLPTGIEEAIPCCGPGPAQSKPSIVVRLEPECGVCRSELALMGWENKGEKRSISECARGQMGKESHSSEQNAALMEHEDFSLYCVVSANITCQTLSYPSIRHPPILASCFCVLLDSYPPSSFNTLNTNPPIVFHPRKTGVEKRKDRILAYPSLAQYRCFFCAHNSRIVPEPESPD